MMKIILVLIFSVIALIALVFSLLNFQPVEINLYYTTVSLPLAIALFIELVVGIGIGLLAAFFQIIKLKSQYSKLNKKLDK